ncbi:MAG: acetylxylan esterase [Bryobacterales bacterium]|nr:acetylxylan esterase [Bryobacterales bacterium]
MLRFPPRCALITGFLVSLNAQTPPADPLLEWLGRRALVQLDQREKAIAEIRTARDADRRREMVRKKMLQLIGGLPSYRGPLRARTTGSIQGDGYVIEKVIFESLPGFHVTGNAYRPGKAGRYPGILVPIGHTQEGKPEMQLLAANLAKKGYVAFAYDPIGQGEREQTYLPQLGRPLSGGAGNEHLESGARSILIGQSVARYFIFDAMRAVDYLVSRPDVDGERIGVTGCSGGGAITTYAGAFDARIKAAAPGCFINTFRKLFTGPTPDSEMSFPAFLSRGLDLADFFELPAPLPWLMLATSGDYFTPDGARPVYEEVKRWYGLYGAGDRVRFFVGPGPHGTPKESREEIYRWMNRWLKDGKGDERDEEVKLHTNHELRVTAGGHVDEEPGSRKLYQIILEEYRNSRRQRSPAQLIEALRALGVAPSGSAPRVSAVEQAGAADYRLEWIHFEAEPGVTVHGKLYLPNVEGRKAAVVVVEDKRLPVPLHVTRSPSTAALAEAMARAGRVVLEFEPRDAPAQNDGRPFLGNWLLNERFDLVGLNLPASRARDILVAVDVLAARPEVDADSIRGYARGVKGFWLLMAAAMDSRLRRIWLDRTPWSFSEAMSHPMTSRLFDAVIPGFARHWDFRDLVEAVGERRVFWTDPANWMNQVVFRGAAYRYRSVGEGDGPSLAEFLR